MSKWAHAQGTSITLQSWNMPFNDHLNHIYRTNLLYRCDCIWNRVILQFTFAIERHINFFQQKGVELVAFKGNANYGIEHISPQPSSLTTTRLCSEESVPFITNQSIGVYPIKCSSSTWNGCEPFERAFVSFWTSGTESLPLGAQIQ